jgi:hypothetical protein
MKSEDWPNRNEIYVDPFEPIPDYYSVDCMGNSLTFFTMARNKKSDNGLVRDTYWFIAGMEEII